VKEPEQVLDRLDDIRRDHLVDVDEPTGGRS
jgi:hypothetical protein